MQIGLPRPGLLGEYARIEQKAFGVAALFDEADLAPPNGLVAGELVEVLAGLPQRIKNGLFNQLAGGAGNDN
jgi:hypothetical protein